jgi:hypothetical protein
MRKVFFITGLVCIGFLFISTFGGAKLQEVKGTEGVTPLKNLDLKPALKPDINFGKIPLYFISNKGQVNQKAKFYAKASKYTLWLTKEGLVFDSAKRSEVGGQKSDDRGYRREAIGYREKNPKHEIRNPKQIQNPKFKFSKQKKHSLQRPNLSTSQRQFQRDVSKLVFVGANKNPEILPINATKLKVNYFKGNDLKKWIGGIPTSQAVLYKNLYKNIDLKVYGIEKQIEYDWIVKPEGNPEDVRFEYKNVQKTRIDKQGNLVITTKFGELIHKSPISYQEVSVGADHCVCPSNNANEKRIPIKAVFKKISKNTYGFNVGKYDEGKKLIIDPVVLAYSTYLGGFDDDAGNGIAVDSSGNVYVTGRTYSTDFPTLNQYMSNKGGWDVFVTKLDTTQSGTASLLYSTYLGGGGMDYGNGIAVDSSGYVYVTGETWSGNFPVLNAYMGHPGDSGYENVFVTKLDTTQSGTASLLYSTYLGGLSHDYGNDIAVDSYGNAFVTGYTASTDFPVFNDYMGNKGSLDAFVTKLDTTQSGTASLLYSTYLGGGNVDHGNGIALDSSGYVYVTGKTWSENFPVLNEYISYPGDSNFANIFVTKLDTTQSGTASLLYSTYLGGSSHDYGNGIAVDSCGNAYVTGYTSSTDFPVFNEYMGNKGSFDAFVTKLDTTQSGTASLLYSTYLGGGNNDFGNGIAVDSSGYVYVTGETKSPDFPVLNQYMSSTLGQDAIVTKLDTSQSGTTSLIYSTYLGGGGSDYGHDIAVDSSGYVYVTGETEATNFPTFNPYMTEPWDDYSDAFVTRLIQYTEPYPLVLTKNVTSLKAISVNCGGRVLAEGGSPVIFRGVCWSTTPNPTLFDSYTTDGSGLGDFTSTITGLTPDTTYYVRAYATNNEGLDYGGEIQFTTLSPSITLTSPNGGETWLHGATENITWTCDMMPGELVKISLIKPNGVFLKKIADNVNADLGTHAVFIPASLPERDYKIKVDVKGLAATDMSDAPFSVASPYITVNSPIGGENWQAGTTEDITWGSALLPGDLIKIVLLKTNGTPILEIANSLDPATGTYSWDIPSNLPVRDYLIKIKVKNKNIADTSDSAFSVN